MSKARFPSDDTRKKVNRIIASNENALNTISSYLFDILSLSSATILSYINYEWSHHLSKHVKSLAYASHWQSLLTSFMLFIYQVHNSAENESAERWKIAYQIEAIRLNCSHKYCFSHAYISAMIALAFSGNGSPPLNRVVFFFLRLSHCHCICTFTMFLFNREKRRIKKKHSLRAGIKKCFSEIATSAFCTRSPEITAQKIKSHHEWRFFPWREPKKNSLNRWHSCDIAQEAKMSVRAGKNARREHKWIIPSLYRPRDREINCQIAIVRQLIIHF